MELISCEAELDKSKVPVIQAEVTTLLWRGIEMVLAGGRKSLSKIQLCSKKED